MRGGWLHTGDIARMDEDGYFYIVDRKKELIKVSGFQVWPREIEEVIAAHPQVLEVSVAGIPDPIRGEAPKAWVVLRPGMSRVGEEIRAWCEEVAGVLQGAGRGGVPRHAAAHPGRKSAAPRTSTRAPSSEGISPRHRVVRL